jgi:hypothetical protein
MDIDKIIADNLPSNIELTAEQISALAKVIKKQQGENFVPKSDYRKKLDKIEELEKLETPQDDYKEKYELEKKEFDLYKQNILLNQEKEQSENLLKKHLKESGAPDDLIPLFVKSFDLTKLEIEENEGVKQIKEWDTMLSPLKERHSKYFGKEKEKGVETPRPPSNESGNGKVDANAVMNSLLISK